MEVQETTMGTFAPSAANSPATKPWNHAIKDKASRTQARHRADGQRTATQADNVDMQRARKQEECEHALKYGLLEINLAQEGCQTFVVEQPRHHRLGTDDKPQDGLQRCEPSLT